MITDFNQFPSWMTDAVVCGHKRLVQLSSKCPKLEREPGYFLNSENSAFNRKNDAPKTRGLRFDLEIDTDGAIQF